MKFSAAPFVTGWYEGKKVCLIRFAFKNSKNSTLSKYISPSNLALLQSMRPHTLLGHGQVVNGVLFGAFRSIRHVLHAFIVFSIAASIPGQ